MGKGRYDFSLGEGEEEDTHPDKKAFVKELLSNPAYAELVNAVLGGRNMVNARVGALPTLGSHGHYGYWHRDAYSLFEDEAITPTLEPELQPELEPELEPKPVPEPELEPDPLTLNL
jgi:hypothetical protein